jgi:hypothetical protein
MPPSPPTAKAFVEIDTSRLNSDIRSANAALEAAGENAVEKFRLSMLQVADDVLAEAQEKAPHGDGALAGSGQVVDASKGEEVLILVGFNIIYAHIRDQGGVIRPVKAKALFIPLTKGAKPGMPGLVLGVDFQLVPGPMTHKTEVRQEGTRYLTATFEARQGTFGLEVGKVMQGFLVEAPE